MKNPLITITLLIFSCVSLVNCSKDDDKPQGKIHITIDVEEQFSRDNFNGNQTTVKWGCLSITSDSTACTYFYNGVAQVNGSLSNDAIEKGPNLFPGMTFINPLQSFLELDGGPRAYSYFNATFIDETQSTIGVPIFDSGYIDLYASSNSNENFQWMVTFKTDSIPYYEIIE